MFRPMGKKAMGRATRVLARGIQFGEGPRWHQGRLWFSDFHAHAVKSVAHEAAAAPEGMLLVAKVDSPRAGLP